MCGYTVYKLLHGRGCLKLVLVKRVVYGASYLGGRSQFHISLLLPKKPFVATVQGKGDLSHWLCDSNCSKSKCYPLPSIPFHN